MAARLAALLPRLIALSVIWLLGAATYSLAADTGGVSSTQTATTVAATGPKFLVVPDVRKQAYVFAEGILEDAGFAWKVEGDVHGYAANAVAVEDPAPGTKVVDNGAPTVVLRLSRNDAYKERGLPQDGSSFRGTPIVLANAYVPPKKKKTEKKPAAQKTSSKPAASRPPAFTAPGAPPEPKDEMPLPDRARLLAHRVEAASSPSPPLVRFWLYQHAWIVTGARFGWSHGAEALRTLIGVDERLQSRWGFGARSEAAARRALAYVESRERAK